MFFAYALVHYFYPRHTNNHKAKLLHSSTLLFLIFTFVLYQVILRAIPYSGVKILGYASDITPAEVISLTNNKRTSEGLSALSYNSALAEAARKKGEDMLEKDYWAHIAPDGVEPWKFFVEEGYRYRFAGENLARDFPDETSAVSAWMASPSHRENILSSKYEEIGIAVVEGDLAGVETTIIVQLFGTKMAQAAAVVPTTATETEGVVITTQPTQPPETAVLAPVAPVELAESTSRVLISPFNTTRGISLTTIATLLIVLVIDGVVVSNKKITRIGGRTFAHLAFLGMVLAIVLIAKAGAVL